MKRWIDFLLGKAFHYFSETDYEEFTRTIAKRPGISVTDTGLKCKNNGCTFVGSTNISVIRHAFECKERRFTCAVGRKPYQSHEQFNKLVCDHTFTWATFCVSSSVSTIMSFEERFRNAVILHARTRCKNRLGHCQLCSNNCVEFQLEFNAENDSKRQYTISEVDIGIPCSESAEHSNHHLVYQRFQEITSLLVSELQLMMKRPAPFLMQRSVVTAEVPIALNSLLATCKRFYALCDPQARYVDPQTNPKYKFITDSIPDADSLINDTELPPGLFYPHSDHQLDDDSDE